MTSPGPSGSRGSVTLAGALLLGLLLPAPAALAMSPLRPVSAPRLDRQPAAPVLFARQEVRRSATRAFLRASRRSPSVAYRAPDGTEVNVESAPEYAGDDARAQRVVDFLGGLPHGSELRRLRVFLAPPDRVPSLCGGTEGEGIVACYILDRSTMVVPGEEVQAAAGVSSDYVTTHEYGHHVAANRSNPPFDAIDWGPKYWASYELVCDGVSHRRYFPGDEQARYGSNPGENWAEVYARLTYPAEPWRFDPSLKPNAAALSAARRDVTQPWRKPRTRTLRGSLGPGRSSRSFRIPIRLDGTLAFRLRGPTGSSYDLALSSGRQSVGRTRTGGSRDVLRVRSGCRERASETVTLRVTRRAGSGRFSVQATYPG